MGIAPRPEAPLGFPYIAGDLAAHFHLEYQRCCQLLDRWRIAYRRAPLADRISTGTLPRWYNDDAVNALSRYQATGSIPMASKKVAPLSPRVKFRWSERALKSEFWLEPTSIRHLLKGTDLFHQFTYNTDRRYTQEVYEYLAEFAETIGSLAETIGISRTKVSASIRGTIYEGCWIKSDWRERLYPRACLGYVWQETTNLHQVPRGTNRWKKLSEAAVELDLAFITLLRIIEAYPQYGPIELRRFDDWRVPQLAMPKAQFYELAAWLPDYPDLGWRTLSEHCRRTGWSDDKIKGHLDRLNAPWRPFRAQNGIPCDHYHDSDVDSLGRRPAVPPGGDWYTERRMRLILREEGYPITKAWIRANKNPAVARDRIADHGEVLPHYPPSELRRLRQLRIEHPPRIGRPPRKA